MTAGGGSAETARWGQSAGFTTARLTIWYVSCETFIGHRPRLTRTDVSRSAEMAERRKAVRLAMGSTRMIGNSGIKQATMSPGVPLPVPTSTSTILAVIDLLTRSHLAGQSAMDSGGPLAGEVMGQPNDLSN